MNGNYLGDPERVDALNACAVVGTAREVPFDNLVFTTSQVMRAPAVFIVMVGDQGEWIKSSVHPRNFDASLVTTLARISIESRKVLRLDDVALNEKLGPMPVPRHIHSALVCPIAGPNEHLVGCLCLVYFRFHDVSEAKLGQLRLLVDQASELLRVRVPGLDVTRRGKLASSF